ncbi:MAG TPA: COX15/CtaA family protein [Burkholderiaceae bacterium]|nr:COX15/CtaA family protein [Burkholderiaceae bacterium]
MSSFDLTPALQVALVGLLLASPVLLWQHLRHRGAPLPERLRALTWLTVFLTFDLVLFGAFTRLSDSGLGCPDWPGCYGSASPLGAHAEISSAQAAAPHGPVTHGKAWVEMIHRYLASGVGLLTLILMIASWRGARGPRRAAGVSPGWATLSFAWVCMQGAFGALTVTLKLYPLVVTLHLLGGVGLLALLVVQAQRLDGRAPLRLPGATRAAAGAVFGLCVAQVALGGWVSANYAVLACRDFPTCHGQWWPDMDFRQGFTLLRELGMSADQGYLPYNALVAIHWTHRMGALLVFLGAGALALRLWRVTGPAARRFALGLAGLLAWQFASGLSNVVLGWPLLAALAHTAGAAALIAWLALLLARSGAAAGTAPAGAVATAGPTAFLESRPHHV